MTTETRADRCTEIRLPRGRSSIVQFATNFSWAGCVARARPNAFEGSYRARKAESRISSFHPPEEKALGNKPVPKKYELSIVSILPV